jgi:hypothetical protein
VRPVFASNYNSLAFIEADLIAPVIVELRRARRGVLRYRRGIFEREPQVDARSASAHLMHKILSTDIPKDCG